MRLSKGQLGMEESSWEAQFRIESRRSVEGKVLTSDALAVEEREEVGSTNRGGGSS